MMELEKEIDSISMNGQLSVKNKIDHLGILKTRCCTIIDEAIENLKKDFTYCPHCKEYYKNSAWETKWITRTRLVCTNSLTGGYLDPYEYEEKTETVSVKECPRGHQI